MSESQMAGPPARPAATALPEGADRTGPRVLFTLLAVLVVSALLRAIPLDAGLPQFLRAYEERQHITHSARMTDGNLRPRFLQYPSLHAYLTAAVLRVRNGTSLVPEGRLTWSSDLAVSSRMLSLGLGVLGTLAMFFAGRALFGPLAGLIAAFLTAINPLHIQVSTDTAVDVSMSTFLCFCAVFIVRCAQEPTVRHAALAGLFAGLSTSGKQPGGILFALIALALFLATLREPLNLSPVRNRNAWILSAVLGLGGAVALFLAWRAVPQLAEWFLGASSLNPARAAGWEEVIHASGRRFLTMAGVGGVGGAIVLAASARLRSLVTSRQLLAAALFGALVFVITNPFMFIYWRDTLREIGNMVHQNSAGGFSQGFLFGAGRYASLFVTQFGVAWLLAAAAFLVVAVRRWYVAGVVLAVGAIVYFIAFSSVPRPFFRYMLLSSHLLDLMAAAGLCMLARFVATRRYGTLALAAGVLLVCGKPAVSSGAWIRDITRTDVREVALGWMRDNLPHRSLIYRVERTPQTEVLGRTFRTRRLDARTENLGHEFFAGSGIDYVVLSEALLERFRASPAWYEKEAAGVQYVQDNFELIKTFEPSEWVRGGTIWIYRVREQGAELSGP